MSRFLAVAVGLFLALVAAVTTGGGVARAGPYGVIEGRVTDGTAGVPLAGQEVVLTVLGLPQPERLAATTDAGGRFRFQGLETDPVRAYRPQVRFQGVDFTWDPVQLVPGGGPVSLDLAVYQPSTDRSAITLRSATAAVLDADGRRQVLKMLLSLAFENGSRTAYVGESSSGRPEVFELPSPPGTLEIVPIDGLGQEAMIPKPGGMAISRPLPPGLTVLVFGYDIAYAGREKPLDLRFDLGPQEMAVLLAEGDLDLAGSLAAEGVVELSDGLRLRRFRVEPPPAAGQPAPIVLTGLPLTSRGLTPDSAAGRAAVVVAGLLAVGGLAVLARRRGWMGRGHPAAEDEEGVP